MLYDSIKLAEGTQLSNLVVASGTTFPTGPSDPPDAGELFYKTDESRLYVYNGTTWSPVGTSDLAAATGNLSVSNLNSGTNASSTTFWRGDGTWATAGNGSVSSVAVSGGSTGLTTSGGPITNSGTITLGGTLAISNGGTGATTAHDAINALLPSQAAANGMYLTSNGTSASWASISATASAGTLTGTTLNSTVVNSSLTSVGTLANLTVTNTITGSVSGNAGTATILATSRNINGVAFNGSADITVTAAAGTLTGTTLNATVVNSSLTSVGTIATGVWNGTAIGATKGGTGLTSYVAGDVLYASATNTLSALAKGTDGQVLTLASGVPTWAAATGSSLPTQTGNSGKFLTTDGTNASWANPLAGALSFGSMYSEYKGAISATATTNIDCSLANNFVVTLAASITSLTFSNVPASGRIMTLTLFLQQDATGSRTVTWPASVKWSAAAAPTLTTTANKIDIISLVTYDGGTTWLGFIGGLNY